MNGYQPVHRHDANRYASENTPLLRSDLKLLLNSQPYIYSRPDTYFWAPLIHDSLKLFSFFTPGTRWVACKEKRKDAVVAVLRN